MSTHAVQVDPLADPRWNAYVRAHPRWTVLAAALAYRYL